MANSKKSISQLTASSGLTGAELVPVVQGDVTKRTTAQAVADLSLPAITSASTLAILAKADTRPVLAALGDSRLAQSLQVLPIAGGYTSVSSMPIGAMTWVGPLTKDRVNVPMQHNLAVSGSTSADALSRVPLVAALIPKPTHCALLTGTNDIGASVPVLTIYNNIVATWQALRAVGIEPIAIADLPRSVASWSVNSSRQSMYLNYLLREAARSMKVSFVDATEDIADSTNANGDPKAGYTYDGIHPATPSAYKLGARIAALFSDAAAIRRPGSRVDVYNAANNPLGNGTAFGLMTGTTGTKTSNGGAVSGNVADGWNVRSLTGTGPAVCSKVARTDAAGEWQQVVMNGAGTGVSTYRVSLITTLTAADIGATVGDRIYMGVDVEVDLGGSTTGLEDLAFICDSFDGVSASFNSSKAMKSTLVASTYYPYAFNWTGRVVTEPYVVRSATDQILLRIEGRVNNASITFRLGSFEVRKAV